MVVEDENGLGATDNLIFSLDLLSSATDTGASVYR